MTKQRLSQQYALWLKAQPFLRGGLTGGAAPAAVSHSLEAIEQAIKAGCGVVLEAQLTFDGDAVVFGEPTLDRLTDLTGQVRDYSSARLQEQELKGSSGRIMSLSCLLPEIAGRTPVLIDATRAPARHSLLLSFAIRRALEGYGGPIGVISPDPRTIAWFGTHSRRVARGLILTDNPARPRWFERTGLWRTFVLHRTRPDFCVFDLTSLPSDLSEKLRRQNVPVLACPVRTEADRAHALAHADNFIEETPIGPAATDAAPTPAQTRPVLRPVAAARS